MASVNLSGILRESLGDFAHLNKIRFTHSSTTGTTLAGFQQVLTIPEDGSYDIDLEYGNVFIESKDKLARDWFTHGTLTINADTVAADLPTLLNAVTPPTDEQLLELQTLLAEATTARDEAVASAAAAAISASDAADSVEEATADAIEQQSGGMNRYRQDSNGNWNMMVRIPMMTNKVFSDALGTNWLPETDPHPAFIRPDSSTMPWFEFGMYQASNDGSGNPVSAAYKDPYTYVNFDSAKSKCSSMGAGWGLISNAQWAAISLWCLANGYQPLGNTYYGYSHEKTYIGGIRRDGEANGDASGTARILTGSGGVEFRHNKITQGISDMVGNVWEWVDGLKIEDGQIYVATTERQDESSWQAQSAYLDTGNKLNSSVTGATSTNVTWGSLGKDASYVENQLLQQHCIEPVVETSALNGRLYYNNDSVRLPMRGGSWYGASSAGLAALTLNNERTISNHNFGFRPAYFE